MELFIQKVSSKSAELVGIFTGSTQPREDNWVATCMEK
jgi:hypothetical protein